MLIILLIFLIIYLLISLNFIKDVISPIIIYIGVFIASVSIASINIQNWGDISPKTTIVIVIGVFAFSIGSIIARLLIRRLSIKKIRRSNYILSIKPIYNIVFVTFMLLVTYAYFIHVYQLSINAGNTGGLYGMLSFARSLDPDSEGFIKLNPYLNIALIISQAIGFIYMFILIYNKVFFPAKIKLIYFLPIFFYTIQSILTTGRVKLVNYIIFAFILLMILNKLKYDKKQDYLKLFKYVLLTILIVVGVFILLDLTLRSSIYGTTWGIFYQLSKYGGSSIRALDIFLENHSQRGSYETMYNIYSILNRFGFNYHIGSNALSSVNFGNISTNVYTPLRRYINDYGMAGMIFIQILSSFLISFLYEYIKKGGRFGLSLIMYAFVIYFVFYSSFEERLFLSVISLNSILTMMFIVLFWMILKINRKVVLQ